MIPTHNLDIQVIQHKASENFNTITENVAAALPEVTFQLVRGFYYVTGTSLRVLSFLGY